MRSQIVPTEYTTRLGQTLETGSYSVSEYAVPLLAPGATGHGKKDPFVDLIYDLSPIVMHVKQSPLDLLHFLVRLCAVVGGALSVTRLFDGLVHGAVRALGLYESEGRRSSASGRGMASLSAGGLLPTSSSCGSGSGIGSPHGSIKDAIGSLGASLLRRSSAGSAGGALAGLGGPSRFSSSGGERAGRLSNGAPPVQMSSLSGLAAPALTGFGSWTDFKDKKDIL